MASTAQLMLAAEILDLATHLGLSIAEVPVQWSAVPGSKVRAVRDSLRTAIELGRHRSRRGLDRPVAGMVVEAGPSAGDQLLKVVMAAVRRTDLVTATDRNVTIMAAGASELAHRRIADRLAATAEGRAARITTFALGSLRGRID